MTTRTNLSTWTAALVLLSAVAAVPASAQPGAGEGTDARPQVTADANATRLFFGPTGRSLGAGEGYVGVYQFLLPFVQVGVTDRVTLGGGTPLFFGGGSAHPVWLTPKVQLLQAGRLDVAAGVLHFFNLGEEGDEGNVGIAYGVATYGSHDAAITAGAGWGYSRFEDQGENATIVMVGGERRVGRRLKLVTENYVFDGGGILCAGVRFLGESLSADLGLATTVVHGDVFAFPMANFVWRFGRSGR